MNIYKNNEVLDLDSSETPSYSRYFNGDIEHIKKNMSNKSLESYNKVYFLIPDYERIMIKGFLVEPVSVEKSDVSRLTVPVVFSTHVCMLVKPHVRGDSLFELRRVEGEESYTPSIWDNV